MKRLYTIKIKDQAGTETVAVFRSKPGAMAYCREAGAKKGRFDVEITVSLGSLHKTERFTIE